MRNKNDIVVNCKIKFLIYFLKNICRKHFFLIGLILFNACTFSAKKEINENLKDSFSFCSDKYEISQIDSFPRLKLYPDEKKRNQLISLSENSYEQDTLIEKYLLSKINNNLISRNGDTLKLKLENGSYYNLINDKSDDEDIAYYTLNYVFEREGFYLLNCQFFEGKEYVLISMKTGEKIFIIGYPYFSPDLNKILIVSDVTLCAADYGTSGLQLMENKNGYVKKILECDDWYASYAKWTDNETFNVAKTLSDDNCNFSYKFYKIKTKHY